MMVDLMQKVDRKTLTKDDKIQIAKAALIARNDPNDSIKAFGNRLGIDDSTIYFWMGQFTNYKSTPRGPNGVKHFPKPKAKEKVEHENSPKNENELQRRMDALQEENTELKNQLSDAKQKIEALQNVIVVLGVQL